ncbi:hypothetical protein [Actinoplanes sp. NPDC049118]|uniref:hypothetical protein n=1 Tax=Actinoplanes sp. NPDC049118 TaxID=3155769 RepID=UPI0033DD622A
MLSETAPGREAVAAAREAVAIWRALAGASPAAHRADLAHSLRSYAMVCVRCRRDLSAARDAAMESAIEYQRLAILHPEAFGEQPSAATATLIAVMEAMGKPAILSLIRQNLQRAGLTGSDRLHRPPV